MGINKLRIGFLRIMEFDPNKTSCFYISTFATNDLENLEVIKYISIGMAFTLVKSMWMVPLMLTVKVHKLCM